MRSGTPPVMAVSMRSRPVIAIVITLLAIQAPGASAAKNDDRPNIIFFIVDDYDKETSSAYSGPAGLTPSMEDAVGNFRDL